MRTGQPLGGPGADGAAGASSSYRLLCGLRVVLDAFRRSRREKITCPKGRGLWAFGHKWRTGPCCPATFIEFLAITC